MAMGSFIKVARNALFLETHGKDAMLAALLYTKILI
jgi:hypothetical protein